MKKKKIITAFLFTLFILLLFPIMVSAEQGSAYLDENGDLQNTSGSVVVIDSSWTGDTVVSGWYIVSGTVTRSGITVNGDVHIILADSSYLRTEGISNFPGITVNSGNSLTIYGQSTGGNAGRLEAISAYSTTNGAGIGGQFMSSAGAITINGGKITADGTHGGGAGIGGGGNGGAGGIVTINGGIVTAYNDTGGAGIGGGQQNGSGGTVTINGGTVTATGGGYGGAGIGGGLSGGKGGTISINGGTVTATGGGYGGAGIGGGHSGKGGTISINGGTVTATGGRYNNIEGTGIGGGYGATTDSGITCTIKGGTINASSIQAMPTNGSAAVYLTTITLEGVSSKTAIISLDVIPEYAYGLKDVFTDNAGKIYFYLPENTDVMQARTADTIYNNDGSDNFIADTDTRNRSSRYGSHANDYIINSSASAGGSINPSGEVYISPGEGKTYTITAESGYAISDVQVDGVSVGATSTYTFENLKKSHSISASFMLINPFTDVKLDDWYFENVLSVHRLGLMLGTSHDTFNPNAGMTRAMYVTVLHRLSGEMQSFSNTFLDVPSDIWYEQGVAWAVAKGIVKGVGEGMFAPNEDITREQLAVMLHNYAKFKGYDVSIGAETNILPYGDAFSISDYAYAGLQWACGVGVIKGYPNGDLHPNDITTRAEAGAILGRFILWSADHVKD